MAWVTPDTTGTDRAHILGPGGDLLALHEQAGIQLRILPDLWPFWNKVTATTLGWSGIRLPNARPRP